MTPLQSALIRNDRPTIINRNLRRVTLHQVLAIADGVEDFAIGLLRDPALLDVVQIANDSHPEFAGDAFAVAARSMTGRAINGKSLPAAREQSRIHRQGVRFDPIRDARSGRKFA